MLVKRPNYVKDWSVLWRARRAVVIIAGLFAIVGTALLVRSLAATTTPLETVDGEFIHGVSDNFRSGREEDSYSLKQANGQYIQVTVSGVRKGRTPKTGSMVRVRGIRHDSGLDVNDKSGSDITVTAPPSAGSTVVGPAQITQPDVSAQGTTSAAAMTPARTYTRGVLLVNLRLSGSGSAIVVDSPLRSESEENSYLATALSPDRFWAETSYGQLGLTSKVVGTVTITIPNTDCTLSSIHTWADLADSAAAAAGMNISQFTNISYVVPMDPYTSTSPTCGWGGFSDIGGRRSWLSLGYASFNTSGMYAKYLMGTEAHEFGHNLGLLHSSAYACTSNGQPVILSGTCTINIYGDLWDVMGSQSDYRLLDNYHREQLGFIPASKVRTVTASGTYALASSDLSPGSTTLPQSLRIARAGSNPAQYFEIEARSPSGTSFDNFAATDKVVNGFLVRVVPATIAGDTDNTYLIDAEPSTTTAGDAAFTTETFSDPLSSVRVSLMSRSAGQVALSVSMNGVSPSPSPAPVPVPGDANGDGRVNTFDYSILAAHDGENYPPADFNNDGTIGASDLSILLAHWTW